MAHPPTEAASESVLPDEPTMSFLPDDGECRLLGPCLPSTSAGAASRTRQLPADLLRQASRRLEIMALLLAFTWGFSTVLYHLIDRVVSAGDTAWLALQPTDRIVAIGVVLSLALFFYVRRSRREPGFILDLGLVFMVVSAFVAGVIQHWDPRVVVSMMPMLSWTGILVLLFAAVLPNDPVRFAVAAVAAVSMNPIGMLVARARGVMPFDSALTALTMHYPDYIVVGLAVVISRVVLGLGQQVARAREMGSYRLGELIARGGMGEVYKASHRMLARPAAIKLIRPEMMATRSGERADRAVQRFHREAEAASQLRSPHTVGLYDFGAADDGTFYFAMELLDGFDLETLVRRSGPLPASRIVHILLQVCESLEEAHSYGLVHRDIKPANIHVGRFGLRDDFVKVLDFGLVTAGTLAGPRTSALETAIGTVQGTPAYMAPEMVLGGTVDGRADIYALGCVAYFLLTGQTVFAGGNALQSLMSRLDSDPVPPSARTELPIPADLEALVLSCLAREPSDRPASARDLIRSLTAVDVEPWTPDQARDWWAAHRPTTEPTRPA